MQIDPELLLSLLVAAFVTGSQGYVLWGLSRLGRLSDVEPVPPPVPPRVSIVVSALDEADTIEPALASLLAIDYPALEIVAIDDRSRDATGEIIERMSRSRPALRTRRIDALPPGWLGKNHALHQGARLASGDYLLFTDADVHFQPSSLSRAIRLCEARGLAHLVVLPRVPVHDRLLALLIQSFSFGLCLRFQPWRAARSCRHHFGVGAFNLVRRDVYLEAGGHAVFPMEVIDDIALGKLMKSRGARQEVLLGGDMVTVEWYRTVGEMSRGLEKNIFAGFGYSIVQLAVTSLLFLLVGLWPWYALIAGGAAVRAVAALTLTTQIVFYALLLRDAGISRWSLVYLPLIAPLSAWIWWRGSLKALLRGEVRWRGTAYPLRELKRRRFY